MAIRKQKIWREKQSERKEEQTKSSLAMPITIPKRKGSEGDRLLEGFDEQVT
jgi:hypothetical protein